MKNILSRLILLAALAAFPAFSQNLMIMPYPKMQFFSNTGAPLAAGCLFSYQAGTTTLQATYTDSTGFGANPNPLTLDAGGRASVWFSALNYKMVLTAPPSAGACATGNTGATVWTVDWLNASNVLPALGNIAATGLLVTGTATFANGASCGSTGCSNMVFPNMATFNGGITVGSSANSTIYIGGGGSFYNRTFTTADASCAGITDGWMAVRTDTSQIEFCAGGVVHVVSAGASLINATSTSAVAFTIKQTAGNINGDVFEIQDASGGVGFAVTGAAASSGPGPNAIGIKGNIVGNGGGTSTLGLSSVPFGSAYVTNLFITSGGSISIGGAGGLVATVHPYISGCTFNVLNGMIMSTSGC